MYFNSRPNQDAAFYGLLLLKGWQRKIDFRRQQRSLAHVFWLAALTERIAGLALVALLDEVVNQLARGVVHFDVERFHAATEVVEGHNGRDRNQ